MAEPTYQFTRTELTNILDYTTHRAHCELITYRYDQRKRCTCGLIKALLPILQLRDHTLIDNNNAYNGRSTPQWLTNLIPAQHRPINHTPIGTPSPMSDG